MSSRRSTRRQPITPENSNGPCSPRHRRAANFQGHDCDKDEFRFRFGLPGANRSAPYLATSTGPVGLEPKVQCAPPTSPRRPARPPPPRSGRPPPPAVEGTGLLHVGHPCLGTVQARALLHSGEARFNRLQKFAKPSVMFSVATAPCAAMCDYGWFQEGSSPASSAEV